MQNITSMIRKPFIILTVFIFFIPVFAYSEGSQLPSYDNSVKISFDLQNDLSLTSAGNKSSLELNSALSDYHMIFGYATVAMGIITGILNPNIVSKDIHEVLGYTTAGMSVATMALGFSAHYGEIGLDDLFSSNNIHTLLGVAGGTMMALSPFFAPSDTHQVLGQLGTLAMGMSIVLKFVY